MNAAYSRLGLVRDARSKLNPMTGQRFSEGTWVLIVASEYFEHYQFVDALSEDVDAANVLRQAAARRARALELYELAHLELSDPANQRAGSPLVPRARAFT